MPLAQPSDPHDWADGPPVRSERLSIRLPARPEAVGELRRKIVGYAVDAGAGEATRDAVALAASEALTNVVVHAYRDDEPGDMIVEAWRDQEGHLLVSVRDEGRGMLPRTDSPGLGFGLSLMAQMADDLRFSGPPQQRGTTVSLCFSLDGSGASRYGRPPRRSRRDKPAAAPSLVH